MRHRARAALIQHAGRSTHDSNPCHDTSVRHVAGALRFPIAGRGKVGIVISCAEAGDIGLAAAAVTTQSIEGLRVSASRSERADGERGSSPGDGGVRLDYSGRTARDIVSGCYAIVAEPFMMRARSFPSGIVCASRAGAATSCAAYRRRERG